MAHGYFSDHNLESFKKAEATLEQESFRPILRTLNVRQNPNLINVIKNLAGAVILNQSYIAAKALKLLLKNHFCKYYQDEIIFVWTFSIEPKHEELVSCLLGDTVKFIKDPESESAWLKLL